MKSDVYLGVGLVVLAGIFWTELGKVKNPAIMKDEMSAAVFPWLMVGTLAFLGCVLAISSFVWTKRGRRGEVHHSESLPGWHRLKTAYVVPLLLCSFLGSYIFLIPLMGFYSMTVAFFLSVGLLLGGWGRKNVVTVALASVGAIILVYYVFQLNMGVIMPSGFLR